MIAKTGFMMKVKMACHLQPLMGTRHASAQQHNAAACMPQGCCQRMTVSRTGTPHMHQASQRSKAIALSMLCPTTWCAVHTLHRLVTGKGSCRQTQPAGAVEFAEFERAGDNRHAQIHCCVASRAMAEPRPFTIDVPQQAVDDLNGELRT